MRLPLRWKLTAVTALPLLLVAVAVGAMVYRSLNLRSTAEFEARSQHLHEAVASQLDTQLARAAQVARCTAAFVAANPDLSRAQIERTLAAAVRQEPLIFGAAVAFEPHAFAPSVRLFAPYVARHAGGSRAAAGAGSDLRVMDIGAESYDYTDPRWEWYRTPRESRSAAWTEPYFDAGAGDAMLCTFGVPIERDGTVIGVATVDVPVAELQGRLTTALRPGESLYILSRRGAFVSAPDSTLVPGRTLASIADERGSDDLRRLNQLLLSGRRGIVQCEGIAVGEKGVEPTWYFFGPVPTTLWALAVVVPERTMPDREQREFGNAVPTLALGLLAVSGCVWVAARRFTRPIDDLTRAVKSMSSGRFEDVMVPRVRSRDEIGDLARSVETTLAELRGRVPAMVRTQVDHELRTRVEEQVEREVVKRLASEAARSGRRPGGEPRVVDCEGPVAVRGPEGSEGAAEAPSPPDLAGRQPYQLRRRGGDELEGAGDLADAVARRDGLLILAAIGAHGAGIAAVGAAHSVRALLRGLAATTDDAARLLRELARLSGGLEQEVSLALAIYRPGEGVADVVVAGDAQAWVMRRGQSAEPAGEPGPRIASGGDPGDRGDSAARSPGSPGTGHEGERPSRRSAHRVQLDVGDRLTLLSRVTMRDGRPARDIDCAQWVLVRRA